MIIIGYFDYILKDSNTMNTPATIFSIVQIVNLISIHKYLCHCMW